MRFTARVLVGTALALPLAAHAAHAQSPDTLSLQGKSFFSFGLGLTGARDAANVGATQTSHTTGQVASFGFTHFARPGLAVEVSTAVLDADAINSPGRQHANAIVPILFGVGYSPRALALSPSLRPFVAAAVGPYMHLVADQIGTSERALTETAPGARLGTGVNWYLARHFLLQVEADYHAVGHFDHPDVLTRTPSGFGVSAGFGLGWGGR